MSWWIQMWSLPRQGHTSITLHRAPPCLPSSLSLMSCRSCPSHLIIPHSLHLVLMPVSPVAHFLISPSLLRSHHLSSARLSCVLVPDSPAYLCFMPAPLVLTLSVDPGFCLPVLGFVCLFWLASRFDPACNCSKSVLLIYLPPSCACAFQYL